MIFGAQLRTNYHDGFILDVKFRPYIDKDFTLLHYQKTSSTTGILMIIDIWDINPLKIHISTTSVSCFNLIKLLQVTFSHGKGGMVELRALFELCP